MPTTKFQKVIFSLLTVIITVPLFVFYSIAIEKGGMSNSVFISSLRVIPIEILFAFLLAVFVAGPIAPKIAFSIINPREEKEYITITIMVFSTMILMCPMMSFIATILYDGITTEFLAQWMQKIVINFPFAFFTQLFFIQPFVRFVFGNIFKKQLNQVGAK